MAEEDWTKFPIYCLQQALELIKEELADEITEGFIGYVQDEMKESGDSDAKVVVLHLKLIARAGYRFPQETPAYWPALTSLWEINLPSLSLSGQQGLLEATNDKTAIGDDRNEHSGFVNLQY